MHLAFPWPGQGAPGMSVRQYFAAAAIAGVAASKDGSYSTPSDVAKRAVDLADALIRELHE